jgi:hypothetical protein
LVFLFVLPGLTPTAIRQKPVEDSAEMFINYLCQPGGWSRWRRWRR